MLSPKATSYAVSSNICVDSQHNFYFCIPLNMGGLPPELSGSLLRQHQLSQIPGGCPLASVVGRHFVKPANHFGMVFL
jgi:hypothetical protein